MINRRTLNAKDFPIGSYKTHGLCRVCRVPIPPKSGRRTTCSPECGDRLKVLCVWSVQVSRVLKRDKHRCQLCGLDMAKLKRIAYSACRRRPYTHPVRILSGSDRAWIKQRVANWEPEIDHIVPVSEGGGVRPDMSVAEVLANLRTLCHECHVVVTAALARRRAARKREARMTLFTDHVCKVNA